MHTAFELKMQAPMKAGLLKSWRTTFQKTEGKAQYFYTF